MTLIDSVYNYAERSEVIDPEHVIPLAAAAVVAGSFLLDIRVATDALRGLDNTVLEEIVVRSLQGTIASILPILIYTADKDSFRVLDSLKTKEHAMGIVLLVMLAISYGNGFLSSLLLGGFSYTVVQGGGLLFLLLLGLVHLMISRWRLDNELPHIAAGLLLMTAPHL